VVLQQLVERRPAAAALGACAAAGRELVDGARAGRDLALDLTIGHAAAVAHVHGYRLSEPNFGVKAPFGAPEDPDYGAVVVLVDEPSLTVTPLIVTALVGVPLLSALPNVLIFWATARPAASIWPRAEYL
jgi:hypothetical protein